MRTETISVFEFKELNAQSQKRALEEYKKIRHKYCDSDTILIEESFQDQLFELGYEGLSVYFSLSRCQGDGVAFYGPVADASKIRKRLFPDLENLDEILKSIDLEIVRVNGCHYNHYNTMQVEAKWYPGLTEAECELANLFISTMRLDIEKISRKLEQDGYDQIEFFFSEENLREELNQCDWLEFREDGRRYKN